ncbi:MAG: hypothetical protein ACI92S_004300 [Planctomycetaceae bacterium]
MQLVGDVLGDPLIDEVDADFGQQNDQVRPAIGHVPQLLNTVRTLPPRIPVQTSAGPAIRPATASNVPADGSTACLRGC